MPTVLVVDDQEPFRAAARLVLAVAGWDVAEVATGEEAVAAAAGGARFDAVVMDVQLPGIDGVEATRRILRAVPGTEVILVSARRAEELPPEADGCGARAYLPKESFTAAALTALLDGVAAPGAVALATPLS